MRAPRGSWLRLLTQAGVLVTALAGTAPAQAADAPEKVLVADPYIELHTGAGRGYPVFFVVPRDESIEILSRHVNAYLLRFYFAICGMSDAEFIARLRAMNSDKLADEGKRHG